MKDFKVSLSKHCTVRQYNLKETELIGSIIAETPEVISCDSIRSFVEKVGMKGFTFCPATFNNGIRCKETFEQMQLFALYFDSCDITFSEVVARAESFSLPVLFAYDTFSMGTRKRFTVVFLNDVSIPFLKVVEIMSKALLTIFPEATQKSEDACEIFHGGNKLLYFDASISSVNIYLLIMNMCLFLKERYRDNYKRNVYDFSLQTGLELTVRKMLDVLVVKTFEDLSKLQNESLSPSLNIYIIENGDKSSKNYLSLQNKSEVKFYYIINGSKHSTLNSLFSKKENKNHLEHRPDALVQLEFDCQLCREFSEGNRILNREELFGLAANINPIEASSIWFMKTLKKYSYFDETIEMYNQWEYYLSYMKKTDYPPTACDSFCPHRKHCHHVHDILSTVKPKQHTVRRLANYNDGGVHGVDEAMQDFVEKFTKAMEAKDNNIHVLNASVGVGKSTAVINSMAENLNAKYLSAFYSSNCHAFATHSRMLTFDCWFLRRFDAVIFDEDPIQNCMIPNQVEIPIEKLIKVLEETDPDSHLAKKIRMAVNAAESKTFFTLSRINYEKENDAISTLTDLASFCAAEKFLYKKKSDESNLWEDNPSEDSIVFFKPFRLVRGIKYIILSATANRSICYYCFGLTHEVVFHNQCQQLSAQRRCLEL